ncbi:MAG: penicillin-binding protein activator [Steroidobacteraceae bacterium]
MQAQMTNRWAACAAALTLVLTGSSPLNSWAGTNTSTVSQANVARLANEADQLATQGKYADAAARFEALAAQSNNAERDHFILKAARNAQLAGNDAKTQGLLNLAGKNLNAADSALRAVISATLALRTEQPALAITQLDQVPLPLPEDLAPEILTLRVQALFAAGRTVVAVNTAVERERTLKTDIDLAQNRQLIWNNLKQAATAGRDLTPPAGASRTTAGWLELAKLYTTTQRDPFALTRGLTDWRGRYPGHPGGDMIAPTTSTAIVTNRTGEDRIALLLPLTGRQQAAGIAVRDGFIAATLLVSAATRPNVQIFDTNAMTAVEAYQRATQAGASIVVGPLLKEDVDALSAVPQLSVMTLALNALSSTRTPPALMFQFSLDPEEEARQAAQRARSEGRTRAIVLAPNNEWGQRVRNAFTAELSAEGGTLVEQRSYDPAAKDYVALTRQLLGSKTVAKPLDDALGNKRTTIEIRSDFDYIFLAAQTAQAKQLRPALRFVMPDNSIPIYATSDAYEPESTGNTDLDGLRFMDMPWVINRDVDTESLHDNMNRVWGSNLRSRSRLYAFGVDAYKLVNWLKSPQPQLASPLRGATGLLALDTAGRVHRQSDWAQIVNGKPQPLPDSVSSTTR